MKNYKRLDSIDMDKFLNEIYLNTSEQSIKKVDKAIKQILYNNNLRHICQKFFIYGIESRKIKTNHTKHHMDDFDDKYRSENLDSMGCLYLLEVSTNDEISEHINREIYSNILITNYDDALKVKHRLEEMINFSKIFIKDNEYKYDTLSSSIDDNILSKSDYSFIDDYEYFLQISTYSDVQISCLRIANNDWQLDEYYQKFVKK